MRSADAARQVPWLRYALIATALSVMWLAISLFSSSSSASAEEGDSGSGLLGTVGSLLGGVTSVTGAVGDTLGDVVDTVVAPVAGVVDTTLGTVVGSAGELPTDGTGIIPQLPGIPLLPGDSTPGEPG